MSRAVFISFLMAALAISTLTAQAATKRALLIGINDYKANDPGSGVSAGQGWVPEDLQGAVNDISLMQQVLTSRYGFLAENITRLENTDATRQALVETLESFVASTAPDDIVYVHFSGHGSQVEDLNGDEPDGLDETILPYDARTGDVPDITDDELQMLLAGLPANSLVVLDSCHSGTATRGASAMRARAVGTDPRADIYIRSGEASPSTSPGYILMTGAADYQSALDGPLDEGRYYGLFTLSLARSLGRVPQGATAAALHAEALAEMRRIGGLFGLFAVPEAQLEGETARLAQGILGESQTLARRNAARLPWVEVVAQGDNWQLTGAGTMATRPGAIWAVYPPGEMGFAPGGGLGTLTVTTIRNGDALARLDDPGVSIQPGSRAIQLLEPTPDGRIGVALDQMPSADADAIEQSLGPDLKRVAPGEFARFIVDREGNQYAVYGAGGLQRVDTIVSANPANVANQLGVLARRAQNVNELLSLDNASSRIHINARVNPVDRYGGVRGIAVVGAADAPAYRVRQAGEPRDGSNSLMVEVAANQDVYLTMVNVDPDGAVALLFPNGISEQNGFLPDGLVPAGTPVRIPDSLDGNRAGFNWDLVPPAGIDTIRIFAASDLATAQRIRQYVAQMGNSLAQRGANSTGVSRRDLVTSVGGGISTRGVATVASQAPAQNGGDWTATTLTLVIED